MRKFLLDINWLSQILEEEFQMITLIWESNRLAVGEVFWFCFVFYKFSLLLHIFSSSVALKSIYMFCMCLIRVFIDLFLWIYVPPPYTHMPYLIFFIF